MSIGPTVQPQLYTLHRTDTKEIKEGHGKRVIVAVENGDNHTVTLAFFLNNQEEVYLDCSTQKLFVKHLFLIVLRPLHGLAKWLSIPIQILVDIKNGEFQARIGQRVADLVLIPVLTQVMTLCHLAGVVLAIYDPALLHRTREIAGKLELGMYRAKSAGDPNTQDLIPFLAVCFTPRRTLGHLDYVQDKQDDLTRFALLYLEDLQRGMDPLHGFQPVAAKNTTYRSPVIRDLDLDQEATPWTSQCRQSDPDKIQTLSTKTLKTFKEQHPTWSRRQICQKAHVSGWTYYETKKALDKEEALKEEELDTLVDDILGTLPESDEEIDDLVLDDILRTLPESDEEIDELLGTLTQDA